MTDVELFRALLSGVVLLGASLALLYAVNAVIFLIDFAKAWCEIQSWHPREVNAIKAAARLFRRLHKTDKGVETAVRGVVAEYGVTLGQIVSPFSLWRGVALIRVSRRENGRSAIIAIVVACIERSMQSRPEFHDLLNAKLKDLPTPDDGHALYYIYQALEKANFTSES